MSGRVLLITAVLIVTMLAGCGGNTPVVSSDYPTAERGSSQFGVELLKESLLDEATVGNCNLLLTSEADTVTAVIEIADADGLKALLLDITYDPAEYKPVSVECNELLGDAESTLEVIYTGEPGCVHIGQVLVDPYGRAGFSGTGSAVELVFRHGAVMQARSMSQVPLNPESATQITDTASGQLEWKHTNQGDYDQNGLVSAADMVPLAVFYGDSVSPDSFDSTDARSVIDGDGNGEIGITDITAIGQNFGNSILGGFNIYVSADGGDYPESPAAPNGEGARLIGEVGLDETTTENPSEDRRQYTFQVPDPSGGKYYWLRPVDELGTEGIASTMLTELGVRVPRNDESMAQARLDSSNDTLIWYYYNAGDCNLDGQVGLSDITVVAANYGLGGPYHPNSLEGMIDVNHDQTVDDDDIDTITDNAGCTVAGYNIYASSNPAVDYPATNAAPSASYPVGKVSLLNWYETDGRPYFAFVTSNPQLYHWVRPYDELGNEGTPCELQYPTDPSLGVPTNTSSAAVAMWDEDTGFRWYYCHAGDYNQDNFVTPSDLTSLGQHWGETGPFDFTSVLDVIDGNNNGEIEAGDIGVVEKYINTYIAGYNIYFSNNPEDYTFSSTSPSRIVSSDQFTMGSALGNRATDRLYFEHLPPPGALTYYMWVRPYDGDGNEGVPSNLVVVH